MSSTAWIQFAKQVVRRFIPSPTPVVASEVVPTYEESSDSLDRRDREKILQKLLTGRDGRHVFDVGANVGRLTEQYSRCFPSAALHAFEPNPDLARRLKARFADDKRVTVIDRVVCDRSGSIPFHINLLDATSSILPRDEGRRYFSSRDGLLRKSELPAVTLDDYCSANGINHIDLLKFDIQRRGRRRLARLAPAPGKPEHRCALFRVLLHLALPGSTPAAPVVRGAGALWVHAL
jgi:FkbM family methyltransferase